MDKLRIDYLQKHIDYKVVQHEDMYHFNTDTCLLGEFIKINKNNKVLDVGTNNGALLVYIINKGGIATGLDINEKALEIASLTLKENNFNASLIHADEEYLPLNDLCYSFSKNLKEDGIIYLVYRPSRLNELERKLNDNKLYINEYQMVYDIRKKEAKSVLVKASFQNIEKIKLEDKIIGG